MPHRPTARPRSERRAAAAVARLSRPLLSALLALLAAGASATPATQPAAPPAPSTRPPARPRYAVEARLSADGAALEGVVAIELTNTTPAPLAEVLLWLYPNRFVARPPYLSELNQPYFYPGRFDPAEMELTSLSAAGREVTPSYLDVGEGRRTVCRVPLSLAPGEVGRVEARFRVVVPRRFGRFGRAEGAVVLDGGFYPALAALSEGGFDLTRPPTPADFSLKLSAPGRGGVACINGRGPFAAGEAAALSLENAPYASWILLEEARLREGRPGEEEARAAGLPPPGEARVRYFYTDRLLADRARETGDRFSAGPPGLDAEVLRDYPAEVVSAALDGLDFLAGLGAASGEPLTLIEVPLRDVIARAAPGAILVSDRAMKIYPMKRVLKFHRLALLRAMAAAVVEEAVGAFEREEDLAWAADAVGAYVADRYHVEVFLKREFAKEMLRPYSFIAEFDKLRWIPQVPFQEAYFHSPYERDLFRDDVRRFPSDWPYGKFIYGKLRALFGEAELIALFDDYLGGGRPLRELAEARYGGGLGWFFAQWLGPHPKVNYQLTRAESAPLGGGRYRLTVAVERQGDPVREPVKILAVARGGEEKLLVLPLDARSHTFSWEGAAPLSEVVIDPGEEVYEELPGAVDDLRGDNASPGRYRVVIDGFSSDFSSGGLRFSTAILARRVHDKRRFYSLGIALGAGVFERGLRVGDSEALTLAFRRGVGESVNVDRLAGALGVALTAERLGARLVDEDGDAVSDAILPPALSARLAFIWRYNDRRSSLQPWAGTALEAAATYSLGLSGGVEAPAGLSALSPCGERGICSSAAASLSYARLFSLDAGRVFGARASGAALLGAPLGQDLFDLGGVKALKGYPLDVVEGRARLFGGVELRQPLLRQLDVNLAEVDRWRGLSAVFYTSFATVSGPEAIFSGGRPLFSGASYFGEVGAGLRFSADLMGIDPTLLSLDFAAPLVGSRLSGGPFAPLQVYLGFEENF